jgi:hypothetical protein
VYFARLTAHLLSRFEMHGCGSLTKAVHIRIEERMEELHA